MTDEQRLQKIEAVLDEIRPNLQMDGSDVIFVKFEDGVVYIRFKGTCVNCPASMQTEIVRINEALKEQMSDVHDVSIIDEYE